MKSLKATYPSFEELRQIEYRLNEMKHAYWLHHDLFTFQWWLLLIIFIVPWIIWWRYVDKQRLGEILLFGGLLMILVGLLDDIGVNARLWSYPYQLVQIIPRLLPIDYGILIVAHMTVYQYFSKWRSFIIVNIIMATVFTFIFEPLSVWLNIYHLENWRYIYSFPLYIAKVLFVKGLVQVIQQKAKS